MKTIDIKYLFYRLKLLLYQLSNKRVDISKMYSNKLSVARKDISYFTLSANTITIITQPEGILFFREILHHDKVKDYFRNHIERFLNLSMQGVAKVNFKSSYHCQTQFPLQYVESFRAFLQDCITKHDMLTKIIKCNFVCRESKFSLWSNEECVCVGGQFIDEKYCEYIGCPNLCKLYPEIAPLFLSYMSGSAYTYIINARNTYESFYSLKSVPSYILAKELGQPDLLTKTEFCELEIEGKSVLGVLSPSALGERGVDADVLPTPAMQRDLSKLTLIDILCLQQDHLSNNYNIITDKQLSSHKAKSSICAFDNDNMYTFFPVFNIKKYKSSLCSRIILKDGTINIPFLDKELVNNIIERSSDEIAKCLKPYLNTIQILAFKSRYRGLQRAIKRTVKKKRCSLLDNNEWSEQTIQEEISGRYGETYFCYLFHDIEKRTLKHSNN